MPEEQASWEQLSGEQYRVSTIHGFMYDTRKNSYQYEKQILGVFAVSDGGIAEGHNAKI